MRTNFIVIDDVEFPAVWEICNHCHGEGKSSSYLGAFSREEFEEAFDPEEQEDYFNGAYDRPCEHCNGSGKVQVVDEENLNEEQREVLDAHYLCLAEERQERRMREMGYQF